MFNFIYFTDDCKFQVINIYKINKKTTTTLVLGFRVISVLNSLKVRNSLKRSSDQLIENELT